MSFLFPRWKFHCISVLLLMLGWQANARVVYVDITATAGSNNGTSWANAYTSLLTALNVAIANDSLWVADGTYYPGPSGIQNSTFNLKKNVTLLGGFTGLNGAQETMASQRNWRLNQCVLSGDLDQSGTFTAADAYHIVTSINLDTTSVLDGFTVSGGNAIGSGTNNRGAALYYVGGGGRVRNCIIQGNTTSSFGGGIYASTTALYLVNCFIRNNSSGNQGGGMYVAGTTFLRVHNTVISGNTAVSLGGGALLGSDDVRFIHCTFSGNSGGSGGALYSLRAPMQFRNCIFWGDLGSEIQGTAPIVDHCIVQGGYASGTYIINANPNFKDTDYRIFSCSPAVDAGDSLLSFTTDMDGNPRPFDGNGDLISKWDIGAFEAQVVASNPPNNPIVGPNPSCAKGDNVIYQVTTNNFPTNTYLWTLPGGGGVFDGRTDSNAVAIDWGTSTGTFTIEVVEKSTVTGCSTTTSIMVNLTAPPVVTMSPTGSGSVCDGDSTLLTASGTGVSFQWYRNGVLIPGATGTQYYAKLPGVHNVILTNSSGCRDSAVNKFTLTVNPLPNVTFTPSGVQNICVGQSLNITGTPGSSYQWFRNGVALPGQTSQSISVNTAGIYNLRVTDANGCRDTAATGVQVIVNPLPVVSISPPGTDTLCAGDNLPLTANATNATAYQWYLNGTLLPGAVNNPHPAGMTGIYNAIVTDNNGCQDSAATGRQILIGDFENPVSACRDTILYLGPGGSVSLAPASIDNGSTDNCVVDSFELSQSVFLCPDTGSTVITLTVYDGALNSDACNSMVTVIDSTRPAAICADTTGYLDASGQLLVTAALVDGGSSDNCGIASAVVDQTSFVCADTGMHVITLTLMDVSGSSSSCTSNLTVADSTRPAAVCRDTAVFLDGGGNASIGLSSIENGSTDNCGIANSFLDRTTFSCADVPGVFVTMTVVDVSGNAGTCQAYVRVQDSVPPVAMCRDTVIYIDASGQSVLVPGNVDAGSSDNCGIDLASLSQTLFTCVDTGANFVTLSIQDADTNIATCISVITVLDTIPPVAVCTDTTFYLDSAGTVEVDPAIFGINSYDNCLFFDSAYVNVGPYTCADTGSHPVTLVVRDINGRTDSCSGIVTIADTTAPFVQCRDTSLILDTGGNATVATADLDMGTVDNCMLDTVYISQYAFTCNDVGSNNVVLTATDVYGNLRQCISIVTIRDTVAPLAACQNLSLYLDAGGSAQTTAANLDNGSTDNCNVDTLIATQLAFSCQHTGPNNVQLSVIDADSNVATCTAVVTVLDTIRPVALCSNVTLHLDGQGNAGLTPVMVDAGSYDNCPIATRTLSATAFTCSNTGPNSVTLTVTDPSGNNRLCNSTVTVLDSSPPTAVCTNPTLYLNSSGTLSATVNDLAGGSSDNCGFAGTSLSQSSFNCTHVGQNAVTVTLTDPSNNTSTCTSTLTVSDSTAPTALCANLTLFLNISGTATLNLNQVDNGSSDACGIQSRTLSQNTFNCSHTGVRNITLTVTDINGNVGSCIAAITVLDTIKPIIACRQDTVYLDTLGQGTVLPSDLDNGSWDVCGLDTVYVSLPTVTCANIGTNLVQYTVRDPSGNSDSCAVTVLVLDNMAPVAVCDSVLLQVNASGLAVLTPAILAPNSYDNCAITTSTLSRDTLTCADFGFQTVTLSLSDQYNNQSSCTGVVEVVDTNGIATINVQLGNDTVICNGASMVMDAGPGHASYLWSTGDTTQSIQTTVGGVYYVDVTSSAGCTGNDTIKVNTRNIPEPNLRTESGELVICQNDSLLLQVDPIYSTYLWTTGSTGPTTMIYTGGSYSVQLTDTGGCILNRSINIQFVPFPAPNPSITPPDPAYYCQGDLLELNAGAGYHAYRWNTNQTSQIITAFQQGVYSVEVWNGFGCHSKSAPVNVIELQAPPVTVIQNGDTLTTSAVGTYQWELNNIPIPGATQQSYVVTQTGAYTVQVVYLNGCVRTSNPLNVMVSAESASVILSGLRLYPNPTTGELFLGTIQPIREAVEVRVSDMYGRELLREGFRNLSRERRLDLSGLPTGVYLVEVSASDGRSMFRIVRE